MAKNGFYIFRVVKKTKNNQSTTKKMGERDLQSLKYLLYLLQKISDLEKKSETLLGRGTQLDILLSIQYSSGFSGFLFQKRKYFL